MVRKLLLLFLGGTAMLTLKAANADSIHTNAPTDLPKERKIDKVWEKFDPTIKFGGYIIGKYAVSDQSGQSDNGGFDLRFVRLYMNGYCFNDFYYRLQLEVNGAPGPDKGPRIVDAFIEWQKFDFLRLKLGQFKRPFGFENPYSPLDVGLGSFSQATMKLASISDRNGEHKSSGRDLGFQAQGDLFPSTKDGHKWLHYQIGVFNGQGINHTDKDHFKDIIGGLWICPVKDLAIGGFGWNGKYTNENYNPNAGNPATDPEGTRQLAKTDRKRWGVGLKYESNWTVRSEYIASKGGIVTDALAPTRSDAWYITVGVPIIKNLKLYGRWDCYRDAKTWNSLKADYDLAINYHLGKNLIFQANYSYVTDRSDAVDGHYNTFDIQVAARF